MRVAIILFILFVTSARSYSQNEKDFKDYLIVFLVSGFSGDSVRVGVNKDTMTVYLPKSRLPSGQYDAYFGLKLSDSAQTFNIYGDERQNLFQTTIKKEFQYLYIWKLTNKDFEFDFSNRLRLPE